jgi:hypothetical protein
MELLFGILFSLIGIVYLIINTLFLKSGKVLVFPWRKTLYGRRSGWWIRKDDLDDWVLYWNYIVLNYVSSVISIIIGIILLLGIIDF